MALYFSAQQVLEQKRKLLEFKPVSVKILSKSVQTHRGSKGKKTYSPEVSYSYTVNGKSFESHTVLPLKSSASAKWAMEVIAPFRVGAEAQGYYDPKDPASAFLVRYCDFKPYAFFQIGVAAVCVVIFFIIGGRQTSVPPGYRAGADWLVVKSRGGPPQDYQAFFCALFLFLILGILAFFHYLALTNPPYGGSFYLFLVIFIGAGIYLLRALYFLSQSRKLLGTWAFAVQKFVVPTGVVFNVRWFQELKMRGEVESISFSLLKLGHKRREEQRTLLKTLTGSELAASRMLDVYLELKGSSDREDKKTIPSSLENHSLEVSYILNGIPKFSETIFFDDL